MDIQSSNVIKIKATNIKGLDPVSVYLEDFEPHKGEITIKCWDKVWKSFWGGMGGRTIDEFFLSCDNHYLAKNLSNIKSTVDDYEALAQVIKDHYGEDIDYELNDQIESMGSDEIEWECFLRSGANVLPEIFGDGWWYDIPKKENHEYTYLCKIIDVTKDILRAYQSSLKSHKGETSLSY